LVQETATSYTQKSKTAWVKHRLKANTDSPGNVFKEIKKNIKYVFSLFNKHLYVLKFADEVKLALPSLKEVNLLWKTSYILK
jgi:hypothetical protein